MKIFFSESNSDYSSYTFNYTIYCIAENIEELPAIYNQGFLPYSSDASIHHEIFYLARSLRVNLADFTDSSENRRVDRKLAPLNISIDLVPKTDISPENAEFLHFCMSYAKERFSNNSMNKARFKYILSRAIGTHWLRFSIEDQPVAYVLAALHGKIFHYWYAFLDRTLMADYPLGKWVMWRSIQWAKDQQLDQVYLGTCYGQSALYKARDFKGLTFFDGTKWNSDTKLLKQLCKSDNEPLPKDRFKLTDEPNKIINDILATQP